MTDNIVMPFALSLSKGEWHAPRIRSWFDRLTTNGKAVVSHLSEPQYEMHPSTLRAAARLLNDYSFIFLTQIKPRLENGS